MGDSEKLVEIEAFGARYRVKTDPKGELRIRQAVSYLENRVEKAANDLNKPMTETVPAQLFYAALDITEQLLMLRENIEDDKESRKEEIVRLGKIVDKSLVSRFVKIRMAYGAERQDGN